MQNLIFKKNYTRNSCIEVKTLLILNAKVNEKCELII
jgi:hypothetical protein